ncbi:MAG: site-specific DNA-methyltransferase [Magnetococcales bacterium]|nr:site-specific DNA-methyltransferase [Magnetococcales bacterium]
MKKIEPNDPTMQSADLLSENVERLKTLFPEAFTEGKIDLAVLKELLGGHVDEREEKYGLNWHGKRQARRLALTPSNGTLRPCPEESVDWESTQNLMIEGDNLEVLKLLQKSYAGRVKLIYIDPPYNTGKDFVYPDDYRDNIRNYLELTGQVDGEGRRISSNTEASGRFHTDWLNMMYPRLRLARNLLRDDGVVFISIDDNEVFDLRILMNEIFGEENFIATVIWQKVFSPKNSARHFSEDHDYIIVYAKNSEIWTPRLLPRTEEMESRYSNPDKDPRGAWTSGDLSARNFYSEGTYPITCPSGRIIDGPPSGTYWRVSNQKFHEMDRDRRIWWGADGNNVPRLKRFLTDVKDGRVPQTLWSYQEVGHTQEAKKNLVELLDFENSEAVFETPKPFRLIARMLRLATMNDSDDIILDFFAGSGTTAHAVLDLNKQDGGNRRFILVQLPEPTGQREYPTIAEITKERVRRVIKKFNSEEAGQLDLSDGARQDRGFRVFKLDQSNLRPWEPDPANLEKSLLDHVDHILPDRSEQDLLFELLLKLGLELTVPMATRTIARKAVHAIGGGALVVCLAENVQRTDVDPLAMGILDWRRELAPAVATTFVFRDSAFTDDVAKTNLAAILEQNLPASERAGIRSL